MEEFDLSQIKYVDILYDDIFKMIFTKPENSDILLGLLRHVLPDLDITGISIGNGEQRQPVRTLKRSVFDINCTTSKGVQIIVEVQQKYIQDYSDRMLYYAAYPILSQIKKGGDNYSLTPVYVVSFVNFAREHVKDWKGDQGIISRYSIREDSIGEPMTDALHFVFVELGRFDKGLDELKSEAECLFYCLKNMKDMTGVPPEMEYGIIQRLFAATAAESLSEEDKQEAIKVMTTEMDIAVWKRMAREEGLAEGKAQGMAEGIAEGRAETAKQMKAEGIPADVICRCTGLSAEQVAALSCAN